MKRDELPLIKQQISEFKAQGYLYNNSGARSVPNMFCEPLPMETWDDCDCCGHLTEQKTVRHKAHPNQNECLYICPVCEKLWAS